MLAPQPIRREKGYKSDSVSAVDGVRYTVPQVIRPACMEDTITLRFRVSSVYRDCYVSVYLGDRRIWHKEEKVGAG